MDGDFGSTADGITSVELLNGFSESIFMAVGPGMVRLGWSVFPQERHGRRQPGMLHGRVIRWSDEHDLANTPPSPDFVRDCALYCASLNVACVFGPASGHTFAIDIDVMDKRMSEDIIAIAEDILGATPFMRVGHAPKIALIYRHAPNDTVRSASRRFRESVGQAGENGLEILGARKTLTFHGRHHKTGNYFKWIGASTPLLEGPEIAPLVTSVDVDAFVAAVGARFPFRTASALPFRGFALPQVSSCARGQEALTDGREQFITQLVFSRIRSAGHAVLTARGDALEELLQGLCASISVEFEAAARCDGRWASSSLSQEITSRVRRVANKILAGEIQPDRMSASVGASTPVTTPMSPALAVIFLASGEIESIVNQAETALVAAGRRVYQRGGQIVAVGETPVATASGRQISAQRIYRVQDHALLEHLAASATWERHDGRKNAVMRTMPPMWAARTLAERAGRLTLPVLAGVIGAPTLRPDGSILDQPGYDAATCLLYDPQGVVFPAVAESPTKEDAAKALKKMLDLVSTFPFVSRSDRAVALSGLLTAAVRQSLPTAPMHAYSAPTAGSGKSLCVDLCSILATGRECGVLAQGRTEEETEKRLGAALLDGSPVISLDNCRLPVGGDLLCQLLTQTTVRPRILGRSEAPEVPTAALVAATGNNLVIEGDMTRRTLLCRIDPQLERPEERKFASHPVEIMKQDRCDYVVAALTVLRAYRVAGRPEQATPLGGFIEWSRCVRDALLWLGEADATATMSVAREMDPQLDALTSLLVQWRDTIGQGAHTSRELVARASETHANEDGEAVLVHADLREALMVVAGDGRVVTTRRLGRWLLTNSGRIVANMQITKGPMRDGIATWQLTVSGAGPKR